MLRKALIGFFLALVLTNAVGYYVTFLATQAHLVNTMKRELSEYSPSELTQFSFSEAEFSSLPKPKGNNEEFVYMGEMYDVKEIILDNGIYHIKAKLDKKESKLVKSLVAVITGKIPAAAQKKAHVSIQSSIADFIIPDFSNWSSVLIDQIAFKFFAVSIYQSLNPETQTPPPDFRLV